MKFKLIWYDMDGEKGTDIVEAKDSDDATKKGFLKYNGNPPAKLVSIIPLESEG